MAPTFPAIDTDALDGAIKTLGTQQNDLDTQNSILCSVLLIVQDGKVPWASAAAKQWADVINAYIDDLDTASTGFGNMATSIGTLSKALKAAKSDYDTAKSKAGFIRPDGQWQQNLPKSIDRQADQGRVERYAERGRRGQTRPERRHRRIRGNHRCHRQLDASGWNGAQPQMPNGADPSKYASLHLLAIIFGSVVGNRKQGVPYEENQLKALGMDKNKIKFGGEGKSVLERRRAVSVRTGICARTMAAGVVLGDGIRSAVRGAFWCLPAAQHARGRGRGIRGRSFLYPTDPATVRCGR
jgi:hypothetical protein